MLKSVEQVSTGVQQVLKPSLPLSDDSKAGQVEELLKLALHTARKTNEAAMFPKNQQEELREAIAEIMPDRTKLQTFVSQEVSKMDNFGLKNAARNLASAMPIELQIATENAAERAHAAAQAATAQEASKNAGAEWLRKLEAKRAAEEQGLIWDEEAAS